MRLLVGVLGAFLTLSSAQAQQVGFRPDTETSTATLSVSSVSSSTSAGTALLALVCNTGANEAFVAIGASTVTATTSGMSFPAGFCTSLQLNRGNYIAAVTSSSTTTLRVTYGSGTPPIAGAGSGGGGGGGGLSVTDQTTWMQGSSAFTPNGGVFNDTATLSSGQEGTQRLTTKRAGIVDVDPSGSQLHTDLTSAVPCLNATTSATNSYSNAGTNPANCDLNGALYVNAKGTISNASSAVATSATNSGSVAYNYGYNGTTWDQLQVDGSKNLKVITQSGSTTAATQATASNLNATVVGTGTFSVQASPVSATTGGASSFYVQPTASDNHAVIKNGAGTAYSIHFTNNSATKNYMRLYDAGTGFNGCNSATGIIFGVEIPPTDSGISVSLGGSVGLLFATGLSICVTSGYGSTDTTNATATAMMGNVLYK